MDIKQIPSAEKDELDRLYWYQRSKFKSITAFAKHLGYTREYITGVLNGKFPITKSLRWEIINKCPDSQSVFLTSDIPNMNNNGGNHDH